MEVSKLLSDLVEPDFFDLFAADPDGLLFLLPRCRNSSTHQVAHMVVDFRSVLLPHCLYEVSWWIYRPIRTDE